MGLEIQAPRVQGCGMGRISSWGDRDVGVQGWEYRNTEEQMWGCGLQECRAAGCRGTELRMLEYGAGGVGIGGFGSDSPRQWDAGVQSWRCELLGYRDSGLGMWDKMVQGFGMCAVGVQGCGMQTAQTQGSRL